MTERRLKSIEIRVEHKDDDPITFSSERSGGRTGPPAAFIRSFLNRVADQLLGVGPLGLLSEEDRYRALKNQKMQIEINEKQSRYVDIDSMLIFINNANVVFMQELQNLERQVNSIIEDSPTPEKIKAAFENVREVYSTEEFFNRIENKESLKGGTA